MRKISTLCFIILFFLMSCTDFLDVKSDFTLVVPQSLEDAQAILDDVGRMNEQTVPARGECVSDDYYFTDEVYNGRSEEVRKFYVWDYQPYYNVNNDWGAAYAPIYNANLALELLSKISRTTINQEQWDHTRGSALFYRAFYFFKLMTVFAPPYNKETEEVDHGIALRLDTDFNKLSTRSSVKTCYDQIFDDLSNSVDLLPNHPVHVTRPSKQAVYSLLSNIYHYRGEYDRSLEFADKALSLNHELMDYNADSEIGDFSLNSSPFAKFNKETIFYAELTNGMVFTLNINRANVDSILYASYEEEDLRKPAFFRTSGEHVFFKGTYTNLVARQFGGLSISEIYLNKAESLAKLNRPIEAVETLNFLLRFRYRNEASLSDPTSYTSLTALEKIRLERRKELPFRGIRFCDIKRYNMEGSNIILKRKIGGQIYILEPNSPKYALPLPQDIIDITNMPQN